MQNKRMGSEIPMGLIVAGGGTGGHLFPGIAVAQEFMKRNPQNRVLFIGTNRPFETRILAKTGFAHESINAAGLKGRGMLNQLKAIFAIPKAMGQSIRLLRGFKPALVLGVGGYSAGPVILGAWLLGILCALHEQNLLPGITNRMLAPFVNRIYISFKETRFRGGKKKRHHLGNPIRSDIRALVDIPRKAGTDMAGGRFTILIVGGSQGARAINAAVMSALSHLQDGDRFFWIHQTGPEDESRVKKRYMEFGADCRVAPFFDDMADQYARADLVICRAGATTVAETAALGKSVIFIPFPHAADNHQLLNASALADEGAAEVMVQEELSGPKLAKKIEYYVQNPQALHRLGAKAKAFGKPDAACAIVDDLYRMMETRA